VYASGAPEGIVYAISPTGKESILYSPADQNVINGLAVGKNDVVYAGAAPKGELIKITPSDSGGSPDVKQLLTKPVAPIYGMLSDKDGNIWAAAGNTLYSVTPDDTVLSTPPLPMSNLSRWRSPTLGPFMPAPATLARYTALVNIRGGIQSGYGTYTSPVHDAKLPSKWGTIHMGCDYAAWDVGGLQTRTGDVPHPDESWSDWSTSYTNPAFNQISSPSARYIQYRATFTGKSADPASRASMSSVTIYFLTRNQAPTVKFTIRWVETMSPVRIRCDGQQAILTTTHCRMISTIRQIRRLDSDQAIRPDIDA